MYRLIVALVSLEVLQRVHPGRGLVHGVTTSLG